MQQGRQCNKEDNVTRPRVIVIITNIRVTVIDGTKHDVIVMESNIPVFQLLLFYYN